MVSASTRTDDVAGRLPSSRDRSFALATGFRRIDGDTRPISEIPEQELLKGFGARHC